MQSEGRRHTTLTKMNTGRQEGRGRIYVHHPLPFPFNNLTNKKEPQGQTIFCTTRMQNVARKRRKKNKEEE